MSVENKKLLEEKNIHLWFEGSPLMLCSVRLVLDIDENGIFASAKFMNVQPEILCAAVFDIICYDAVHNEIDRLENCVYNEMEIARNIEFGEDLRFSIQNSETRNVEFFLKSVTNDKGQLWENIDGTHFTHSLKQKSLFDVQGDLNKQFVDLCTESEIDHTKLIFEPDFQQSYWLCSCGCFNWQDEENCSGCGVSMDWLKQNCNIERLKAEEKRQEDEIKQIRDNYERQRRLDIEKQKAEFKTRSEEHIRDVHKQETKKKIKKIILVAVLIAVICGAGMVIYNYAKPYIDYNSAVSAMNSGKYDEAARAFQEMGNYLDSQELYMKCIYGKANAEFNSGNMESAASLYESLGNYYEAYKMYCKANESIAENYIEEKDYINAMEIYKRLGEDYSSQLKSVQSDAYKDAQECLSKGKASNLERAYQEFAYLEDYKKSAELLKECLYCKAKLYYDMSEYGKAMEIYHEISGYKDTKSIIRQNEYLENILSASNDDSAAVWTASEMECKKCGSKDSGTWTYEFYPNGKLHIFFSCANDESHNKEESTQYKVDKTELYTSQHVNGNIKWVKFADIKYIRAGRDVDAGKNTVMSLSIVSGDIKTLILEGNIITEDNITFSSE